MHILCTLHALLIQCILESCFSVSPLSGHLALSARIHLALFSSHMAEHPAGAEIAVQLVEHFEPVRGNLTLKVIPGDGECQFRSIACQVAHYGYEGFRRLRDRVLSENPSFPALCANIIAYSVLR